MPVLDNNERCTFCGEPAPYTVPKPGGKTIHHCGEPDCRAKVKTKIEREDALLKKAGLR